MTGSFMDEGYKNILILCNPQKDYVTGSMGTPEAINAEQGMVELIKTEKDNKSVWDAIYFQMDIHYDNYNDTLEGKWNPVKHCISDTNGSGILSSVNKALGDCKCNIQFGCDKQSFVSTQMIENISNRIHSKQNTFGEEYTPRIFIAGFNTDVTVLGTALTLRSTFPEVDIYVEPFACAGTNRSDHVSAITMMTNNAIYVE